MITLVVVAAWALGWLAALRPALRRRMQQPVCERCGYSGFGCRCRDSLGWRYGTAAAAPRPEVIRGAEFVRTGGDVAWCAWLAAWWPVWAPAILLFRIVRAVLRAFGRAVIAATPLTQPELTRTIAEQQAEIKRLMKEIDGS